MSEEIIKYIKTLNIEKLQEIINLNQTDFIKNQDLNLLSYLNPSFIIENDELFPFFSFIIKNGCDVNQPIYSTINRIAFGKTIPIESAEYFINKIMHFVYHDDHSFYEKNPEEKQILNRILDVLLEKKELRFHIGSNEDINYFIKHITVLYCKNIINEDIMIKILQHPNLNCVFYSRWNSFSFLHSASNLGILTDEKAKFLFEHLKNKPDFNNMLTESFSYYENNSLLNEILHNGNLPLLNAFIEFKGKQFVYSSKNQNNPQCNCLAFIATSPNLTNEQKSILISDVIKIFPEYLTTPVFKNYKFIDYLEFACPSPHAKESLPIIKKTILNHKLNDIIIEQNTLTNISKI